MKPVKGFLSPIAVSEFPGSKVTGIVIWPKRNEPDDIPVTVLPDEMVERMKLNYLYHDPSCKWITHALHECTCGLADLLRELEAV